MSEDRHFPGCTDLNQVTTIKKELIKQAAELLDATPDYDNPYVIEVYFNHKLERIEVWWMLADEERMLSYVEYR